MKLKMLIFWGIMMIPLALAAVQTNNATFQHLSVQQNNATFIAATCGISINSSSINFGTLGNGNISNEQSISLNNTGTASANFTISGTNWILTSNSSFVMNVNQTRFYNESVAFNLKTLLQTYDQTLQGNVGGNQTIFSFMNVQIPSITNITGAINQNATYTVLC